MPACLPATELPALSPAYLVLGGWDGVSPVILSLPTLTPALNPMP